MCLLCRSRPPPYLPQDVNSWGTETALVTPTTHVSHRQVLKRSLLEGGKQGGMEKGREGEMKEEQKRAE